MNRTVKHFLVIVYMGLLLSSCNAPVFTEIRNVEAHSWSKSQSFTFPIEIKQPGRYALYINLRYNENYSFSNLWLRADLLPPAGKLISQRFNIPLFNPDGEPLEDALGNLYFRRFPAQRIEQKLLPFDAEKAGTYTFTLNQEMRTDNLEGVERIGLQVLEMEE